MTISTSWVPNFLTELDLSGNNLHDQISKIANAPELNQLAVLKLNKCCILENDITTMANSECVTQLRILELSNNNIGDAGTTALVHSKNVNKLEVLKLQSNSIIKDGIEAIAASDELTSLRELDIGYNRFGKISSTLAIAKSLNQVTRLVLSGNSIGILATRALLGSTTLTQLRDLALCNTGIGCRSNIFLFGTLSHVVPLTNLDLSGSRINDAFAEEIANLRNLSLLAELNLSFNTIGADGGQALANSMHLKKHIKLNLRQNTIYSEAVLTLLRLRYPNVILAPQKLRTKIPSSDEEI